MKKGMSAIVSTILMITFVITLGVVIMTWSSGLVKKSVVRSETKMGSELDCIDVSLNLEKITDKIIIKNNGKRDLYGYVVRKIDSNNDVTVDDESYANTLIKAYGAKVHSEAITGLAKIEIIPRIKIEGSEEVVDCIQKKVVYIIQYE